MSLAATLRTAVANASATRLTTLCGTLATALALGAFGTLGVSRSAQAAGPLSVRVGFVSPLSGDYANYGRDLENGAQLALDEANAQNLRIGDQPAHFELVPIDDRGDPRLGVQAAATLANQNVNAVVGHFNSGTAIPASRVYESAGIPMISPAATNPVITSQGFANTFMVIANDAQNAGVAGAWAVEVMKAKRVAIVDDRSAFGQGEADVFERTVREHGGNVVAREFAESVSDDFGPQLAKIKAADADLLYFGGLARQGAALVKQMKERSMRAQFVAGGGVANADFIQAAGAAGEGAMAWEYGRPLAQLPDGPRFEQAYRSRFGSNVLAYAPFGYDAAWAAIHAMVNAKSAKPDVYRGALKMLSFDGVTGRIAFEPDGSLKNGASTLWQVKKGVWVPVTTRGG
ncbi:branched-chain amino acid ABC transporter substrate-binding protein [Paraburkholderia lycopersici]|uniref:Branched-chain amino acid transport system substrate-binding protein n=1 Tax=Paraburkholderia lycopersici TaxID=416944 RepID=A0A1G7D1Y1_9BURK|nr:branched-chain amino acid ABC transporter substrate-binding protein [Paraburkholderia lycopersici]SDE45527.1 branched-chain amino acid transport system substrate-binding protein [Paraburkholderia lycopersici]